MKSASLGTRDPRNAPVTVEREAFLMGTALRIEVVAETRASGLEAIEKAFREVEDWESLLSSWRSDSRLSALNHAPPARWTVLPARLLKVLDEVRGWSVLTQGAVDPTVGPLIDVWGLRGSGRRPTPAEVSGALATSGFRCFELDLSGHRARRRCPAGWIDSGAFGKGAALRDAGRALQHAGVGRAVLNFGGQLLFLGPARSSRTVLVADPSRRHRALVRLRVPPASVATTSQAVRGVEVGGGWIGHVLDPRTGRPVPAWGSVTVLSSDPLIADVLSTALFVLGPDDGLEWARSQGVAALFLVARAEGIAVCPVGLPSAVEPVEPEATGSGDGRGSGHLLECHRNGSQAEAANDGRRAS
ncbi:MAG: FAD:protein FMN transferase [Gemmatimonadota bacterium]